MSHETPDMSEYDNAAGLAGVPAVLMTEQPEVGAFLGGYGAGRAIDNMTGNELSGAVSDGVDWADEQSGGLIHEAAGFADDFVHNIGSGLENMSD